MMPDGDKTFRKIRRSDLWRTVLRSFLIQACWNFRSMLSIGFVFSLVPILRRLYTDPARQSEFLQRHLDFFNAHPYFSAYALGIAARLEEQGEAGDAASITLLSRIKQLLCSTLGALGDSLFWSRLKPFLLLLAVAFLLMPLSTAIKLGLLAGVLLCYNYYHFRIRFQGVNEGYQHEREMLRMLRSQRFEKIDRLSVIIGAVAFLLIILLVCQRFLAVGSPLAVFVFALSALLTYGLYRKTASLYWTFGVVLLSAALLGIWWQ